MSDVDSTSDQGRPFGGGSAASSVSLAVVIDRLTRYGTARNRAVDREPRTITITDDEAVALLDALHGVTS